MNINNILEKNELIQSKGKKLLPKQMGYLQNNYEITREELEKIFYYWSVEELILYAPYHVLNDLNYMGYDFSIQSASYYAKNTNVAFMVTNKKETIDFFKAIFIDSINDEDYDDQGNFIDE